MVLDGELDFARPRGSAWAVGDHGAWAVYGSMARAESVEGGRESMSSEWFFFRQAVRLRLPDTTTMVPLGNMPPTVAVQDFVPTLGDELSLTIGDKVQLYEVYRDGWATGTNLRTREFGMLPIDSLSIGALSRNRRPSIRFESKNVAVAAAVLSQKGSIRSAGRLMQSNANEPRIRSFPLLKLPNYLRPITTGHSEIYLRTRVVICAGSLATIPPDPHSVLGVSGEVPEAVIDPRWVVGGSGVVSAMMVGRLDEGLKDNNHGREGGLAGTAGSGHGTLPGNKPAQDEHPSQNKSPVTHLTNLYIPTLPRTTTPVLAVVNPRSGAGSNSSPALLRLLYALLNPCQVCDLSREKPQKFFRSYSPEVLKRCRVVVCGGDGTVGWIVQALTEVCGVDDMPPVAVMPTDLANILHWPPPPHPPPLFSYITSILEATTFPVDRWRVTIAPLEPTSSSTVSLPMLSGIKAPKVKVVYAMNYISVGVDAHIALAFHEAREARPGWFQWRWVNKLIYVIMGTRIFGYSLLATLLRKNSAYAARVRVGPSPPQGTTASQSMSVEEQFADATENSTVEDSSQKARPHRKRHVSPQGVRQRAHAVRSSTSSISSSSLPPLPPTSRTTSSPRSPSPSSPPAPDLSHIATLTLNAHPVPLDGLAGLILQNIPSYAGGRRLYQPSPNHPAPDPSDGSLDVVGVWGAVHMAVSLAHLGGLEVVGRAGEVELVVKPGQGGGVPMQVDGEPWWQDDECRVKVEWAGRVVMLQKAGGEEEAKSEGEDEVDYEGGERGRSLDSFPSGLPRRSTSFMGFPNDGVMDRFFW
ncbi:hypothetical protein HDU93_003961 [Gonapodya sp. JEL0774]|nr:hypothetical protein HDU93_003961 [Gonapodya sp. JEL0774]